MENRIYGEKVNIDIDNTRELYNSRARRIQNGSISVNTSVLLGDQNPEYADEWNRIEKDLILPELKVTDSSFVIDLGCGVGRWAQTLLPVCKKYIGVDFSEGMINTASERCAEYTDGENKRFVTSSVQDFMRTFSSPERVDCFIISYVMMYINDGDLAELFDRIIRNACANCTIYALDTVALEKRITLREIYSDALVSNYSALYRTVKEYEEAFSAFESAGFKCVSSGFMPKLNNEKHFSETDRHYSIYRRL